MVVVPNKSLVVQTEEDYRNLGLDVGVYFGDRKELNRTHTICTWQSLNVLDKKSYDSDTLTLAEFCEGVNAVIIDEVHQAKADVLTKLLTQNFRNCPIRWGLTGTIPKEQWEFQGILASIGPVINRVSAYDLQQKDVLAQLNINILQTNDVQVFRSYQEEYTFLVTDENRLDWISKQIKSISNSGNTLVLINRIDTGNKLINLIPDAVFVSGGMKLDDRKEEYDEIKTSDNKIIIATYGVAAVGINIPRIFNLVLIEPGKSFVRVIQSIGRGIRKAEDKDHVEIWDITSQCKYAKRHLTERKKYYKEAKYAFTITKVNI
jgi:superfamily II DNA or RNA helicase